MFFSVGYRFDAASLRFGFSICGVCDRIGSVCIGFGFGLGAAFCIVETSMIFGDVVNSIVLPDMSQIRWSMLITNRPWVHDFREDFSHVFAIKCGFSLLIDK